MPNINDEFNDVTPKVLRSDKQSFNDDFKTCAAPQCYNALIEDDEETCSEDCTIELAVVETLRPF